MPRRAFSLAAALALACSSDDSMSPRQVPLDVVRYIQDGVHNSGNDDFFWLPPMVPDPTGGPGWDAGGFDSDLAPVIEICALDLPASAPESDVGAGTPCRPSSHANSYAITTGIGGIPAVAVGGEHYQFNWSVPSDPVNAYYRIRARVGTTELGIADVHSVNSGKDLKNVNTGEFIARLDGSTLPVKFRVENGALDDPPGWQVITTGGATTCGIWSGGAAYCWGSGNLGQLGNGTNVNSPVPSPVSGGFQFSDISTSYHEDPYAQFTCGVAATGSAYCWGDGTFGSLGNGTTSSSNVPVAVSGGLVFKSISAGQWHACGVTVTGSAYCWGWGDYGQLGHGGGSSNVPVLVSGGHVFATVDAGFYHTCGVTTTGTALCWGFNYVGLGGGANASPTPALVAGSLNFSSITVGEYHTCGLTTGGAAYCWGGGSQSGLDSPLGTGTLTSPIPLAVTGGHTFSRLSAGDYQTCAISVAGLTYCWGLNMVGQLGDGTLTPSMQPGAPVSTTAVFTQVAAGKHAVCAVGSDGTAYCWGRNQDGRFGNGTFANSSTPVPVNTP